jgi:hypothetical protein
MVNEKMGGGLSRLPFVGHCLRFPERGGELMKNTKFVVKVNRGDTYAAEYVKRIDRTPIQTTTNRKLALVMGNSRPKTPSKPFNIPGAARDWCHTG